MAKGGSVGIIYSRKSLVFSRADETSVERQDNDLTASCVADGLKPEAYSDADGHRSGYSDKNRPEYRKAFKRLGDSDVAKIYIDSIDRAWRNVEEWNKLLRTCQRCNVSIKIVGLNIDAGADLDPFQKSFLDSMASFAELERNLASYRMKRNIKFKKTKGVYHGQTPFGYVTAGEGLDLWLKPNPPHDDTVRIVLQQLAAGMSNARVAEHMNRRAIKFVDRNKVPCPFSNETVRTIARNVLTYAGYVIAAGGRAKARQIALADGSDAHIARYARAMGAIKGQVEPLIDEQLANAVVDRLLKPASVGRRAGSRVFLLGGLLYHGKEKLRAQSMPSSHFYRSRQRAGLVLDAEVLDAHVLSRLCGLNFPAPIAADFRDAIESMSTDIDRARMQVEYTKLQHKRANLDEMLANGDITRARFIEMREQTETRTREIAEKLHAPGAIESLLARLNDLGEILKHATPAQCQGVIRGMIDRFEVIDTGVITRIQLAPWAEAAFKPLRDALESKALPIVPPTGIQDAIGKLDPATQWFVRCVLQPEPVINNAE